MKSLFAIALLLACAALPCVAQGPEDTSIDGGRPGVSSDDGAVPVPEPSAKAMRYYRSGNVLWVVNTLWGMSLPAVLLFTGLSARFRDAARALSRSWFFTLVAYFAIFTVVVFVVELPLAFYQEYLRPHAYGLSNQTPGKWLGDSLKGLLVALLGGSLVLWIPYLLLAKSPRRWWLYTGLASIPLLFLLMLVAPVFIDPLFNDFSPMKDEDLERRILALADRAGIEGGRVWEVDKSVDTETVNAYVTGFLNTKRIVLWDTLIAKLDPDELLFVMGHEMGHYVLGHVPRSILVLSLLVMASLYGAYRFSGAMLRRFGRRFGFDRLADPASLPLILLLTQLFLLVVTPVALAYDRHLEHEADRFGLEITRDNHAAATAFVRLQHENLANPRPGWLFKLWRSTHPTLGDRIDFCNAYRPWESGERLVYEHRLR